MARRVGTIIAARRSSGCLVGKNDQARGENQDNHYPVQRLRDAVIVWVLYGLLEVAFSCHGLRYWYVVANCVLARLFQAPFTYARRSCLAGTAG